VYKNHETGALALLQSAAVATGCLFGSANITDIKSHEATISREYLEIRDPKGRVLAFAACDIRQHEDTFNNSRVPLRSALVLSVIVNIESDCDQILKIRGAYGPFRCEQVVLILIALFITLVTRVNLAFIFYLTSMTFGPASWRSHRRNA
jgi:hypothetical protein